MQSDILISPWRRCMLHCLVDAGSMYFWNALYCTTSHHNRLIFSHHHKTLSYQNVHSSHFLKMSNTSINIKSFSCLKWSLVVDICAITRSICELLSIARSLCFASCLSRKKVNNEMASFVRCVCRCLLHVSCCLSSNCIQQVLLRGKEDIRTAYSDLTISLRSARI